MDLREISAALVGLPLGGLRFYDSIGSTNDAALAWAAEGADDLSLVVADEQTSGRGRSGRKWHTPPGAAIALSMILRPSPIERTVPARITGLGALALVTACSRLGTQAEIKWPNDLLLHGRKVAGILVESEWMGNSLHASVLGIGVNVAEAAVPPSEELNYPATSLEAELGHPVNRTQLLRYLLEAIFEWRSRIGTPDFIEAWQLALAFRDEEIAVGREGEPALYGRLLGIGTDGSLQVLSDDMPTVVHFGEIHLRPRNDKMG